MFVVPFLRILFLVWRPQKSSILNYISTQKTTHIRLCGKIGKQTGGVVPFLRILLLFWRPPKSSILNNTVYPPKKATNIRLCGKIGKQTGDNESPVSQKHPERTTVMRREVKKALGKTRGTSKERKGRVEKSHMLETWKEARQWREDI